MTQNPQSFAYGNPHLPVLCTVRVAHSIVNHPQSGADAPRAREEALQSERSTIALHAALSTNSPLKPIGSNARLYDGPCP